MSNFANCNEHAVVYENSSECVSLPHPTRRPASQSAAHSFAGVAKVAILTGMSKHLAEAGEAADVDSLRKTFPMVYEVCFCILYLFVILLC